MKSIVLAATALLLTACATVQHGPMQRIVVESEPAGAIVETDDCGVAATKRTETPGVVWVSRRADQCALTFRARGYESQTVTLQRQLAEEFLENAAIADALCSGGDCIDLDYLLFGTLVAGTGFALDAATGALFELTPNEVWVELLSVDER